MLIVNTSYKQYSKAINNQPIETVIRENIKMLRKQLGWSQELLAEKTGVSAPYITQIEVGKRKPSLEIVEKLASALGVEYKTLFEPHSEEIETKVLSKQLLESKLISAIIKTIHNEFMV